MSTTRPDAIITPLHVAGWAQEDALKPILERIAGEPLAKTSRRYDAIDFVGDTVSLELKCRSAYDKTGRLITAHSFDTWLLPATKVDFAANSGKKVIFVYHFLGDQSTWVLRYDPDTFRGLQTVRPIWHSQRSEHFYVPRDVWTEWRDTPRVE